MKRILYNHILRSKNVALCCYQLCVPDCIRDKLISYHVYEQTKNHIFVTLNVRSTDASATFHTWTPSIAIRHREGGVLKKCFVEAVIQYSII